MGFASRNPPIGIGRTASGGLRGRLVEAALSGLMLDFALGEYWLRGRRFPSAAAITGWTYTRTGTAYDLAGTTSFGANVPRRTSAGLLVEAGATNLLLRSQEFDNASWTKGNVTITADAIAAPDGTLTADKIAENTTSSTAFTCRQAITVTTGTAYTASIFLRAAERSWAVVQLDSGAGFSSDRSAYFDLANGVLGTVAASTTASITSIGGGWYRCSITSTATGTGGSQFTILTASANNSIIYTGVIGNGIHSFGAQLETGSTMSSYISTTATAASRGADAASVTFTQALPYSVVAEFFLPSPTGSARIVGVNGTANTALQIQSTTSVSNFNGSGAVTSPSSSSMANRIVRAGSAHATGDLAITLDGLSPSTGTFNNADLTSVNLGSQGGTSNFMNGNLRLLAILPRRITNTELQGATA